MTNNLPARQSNGQATMTPAVPQASRIGQGTAVEQARATAQVEAQIVVAMRYPRDQQMAIQAMLRSCSMKSMAEEAFWRFPRDGQRITGESIHLAREIARCWGNVDYGIAELRRDDEYGQSEMLAFAWDLETNVRASTTFIVPHLRDTRQGAKRLLDVRDIYENNANMGARRVREMIFNILPRWYTEQAVAACYKTLEEADNGTPMPQRIDTAVKLFSQMGVTVPMLEARLGAPRAAWQASDLAQLTISFRSIQRGEARKEDEFPAAAEESTTADDIIGQPKTAGADEGKQGGKRQQGQRKPASEPPASVPDESGSGNSLEGAMGAALREHARAQEQGEQSAAGESLFDDEGHIDPADERINWPGAK